MFSPQKIFSLATLLVALSAAPQAQASTIDFTGFHYNMGLVEAGDSGTIATYTRPYEDGFAYDYAYGLMPSMTKIVFTYTFPVTTGENGYVQGEAEYKDGPWRYWTGEATDGWSINKEAFGKKKYHDTTNNFEVDVETVMAADHKSATTTIVNLSEGLANFKSFFFACNCFWGANVTTTYAVTAVPLPAALPLFGLGLVGLAGVRRFRKIG